MPTPDFVYRFPDGHRIYVYMQAPPGMGKNNTRGWGNLKDVKAVTLFDPDGRILGDVESMEWQTEIVYEHLSLAATPYPAALGSVTVLLKDGRTLQFQKGELRRF